LREGLVATIQKDALAAIEKNWRDCADNSEKVVKSDYLQQHAGLLRDLVCKATTNRKEIAAFVPWHEVAVSSTSQEVRYPWPSRLRSDAR
jgi:hypothetical protein